MNLSTAPRFVQVVRSKAALAVLARLDAISEPLWTNKFPPRQFPALYLGQAELAALRRPIVYRITLSRITISPNRLARLVRAAYHQEGRQG